MPHRTVLLPRTIWAWYQSATLGRILPSRRPAPAQLRQPYHLGGGSFPTVAAFSTHPSTSELLQVGQRVEKEARFTADDVQTFARLSGDTNPLHLDADFAATTRFGRPIVHGVLMNGVVSGILGAELPGPGSVYVSQTIKFKAPLFVGDMFQAVVELISIDDRKPLVTLSTQCFGKDGTLLMDGQAIVMVPRTRLRPK